MVVTVPFDTTHVIHPAWARHHMPVTEGAMGATCRITVGGEGGWTPEAGPTPGVPVILYDGRCRVQAEPTNEAQHDAAGQLVTTQTYLVAIPADSPAVPVGDQGAKVEILTVDDNGDADLVGRVFTVTGARYSSLRWERDLTCTDDQTNQPDQTA